MKRVLLLSDSFNGYGAEHILRWLGNSLSEKGYHVIFCAIFDKERNKDLSKTADYHQLKLPFEKYSLAYFIKSVKLIYQLYRKERFNYIITFHTNPFLIALLGKLFCKYIVIHSERDNPYNRDTTAAHFKMWLYRFADKIVFQTKGAQDFFDKKTINKSIIIPNPITIPEMRWKGGNQTIASVGRIFIRFKRQDVLLKAFKNVLLFSPNYRLNLYGDGPDLLVAEQLAKELKIENHVIFHGKVNNVMSQIIEDGIFVLSSDSEGMPNALMEAMALGMPVISTDCEPGGARAIIDNGKNGVLVSRSSVEELSDAMIKLIADKNRQNLIGKNARESMKKYAPEKIITQWLCCL